MDAAKLFAGESGARLQKEIARTYVPGEIDLGEVAGQKQVENIKVCVPCLNNKICIFL